ncbi:hypothetical protein ACSSS7_004360 [Eimeria intestinalis]
MGFRPPQGAPLPRGAPSGSTVDHRMGLSPHYKSYHGAPHPRGAPSGPRSPLPDLNQLWNEQRGDRGAPGETPGHRSSSPSPRFLVEHACDGI